MGRGGVGGGDGGDAGDDGGDAGDDGGGDGDALVLGYRTGCPQIGKDGHTGDKAGGFFGSRGPFATGRLVVELAIISS
jgi:hypothetical protein